MKKLFTRVIALALVLITCIGFFPAPVSAAPNDYVKGFPLAYKGKAYSVSVLEKYSKGSKHPDHLFTYGALKNKSRESLCLVDIMAPKGTAVYAVADGRVITAAYGSNAGHYVEVRNNDGTYTYYGHLSSKYKGSKTIKAGTKLGTIGSAGHIHFEWSGHDPYCAYKAQGLVKIYPGSGAAVYPHKHCTEHNYSGGICTKCGDEYKLTVTSMKATAYKVTKSGGAPIWNRPYSNYSKQEATMKKNSVVVAIAKTTNQAGNVWYKLTTGEWIYSGNVKKTSSTGIWYVKDNIGCLNLRSGPSTSHKVLTTIPENAAVEFDAYAVAKGNWVWVTYNGINGCVSAKYLTTTAPKA